MSQEWISRVKTPKVDEGKSGEIKPQGQMPIPLMLKDNPSKFIVPGKSTLALETLSE